MDCSDLTDAQLDALRKSLSRHVGYFNRLVERMEAMKWNPNDNVYRSIRRARDAAQDIGISLHYASCNGAGKPGRKPK